MAERYQKDSYITMAREAANLLPDYPEKEALESRLDNIGQIPGGETPGDGDQPVQSVSSERVVKAAIFAVERAESNPTRYNILYADRKIKLITNVTPEKETLVARVNKLKVENEKKVAEQNIEKNLVLAEKYVILAEKYKNEYYTKKAEIKVNALLDSEGKILLQNRIENLRQM